MIENIAAQGDLVSIQLYGHPWVSGEYWPMIVPSFQVRATDDAGAEHRGMPGDGGGRPEGSRAFWFWPPVPPSVKRIRVTVSTLWEAAWAELDIPGRPAVKALSVRIGVRHGQEGVVGLGVADADPGAVTGERADGDALVEAGRGEVQGVLAQAEPDEVGLGRGNIPAVGDQRLAHPGPLLDGVLHPLEQLVLGGQRGHRGGLRDAVHAERQHGRPGRGRDRLGRDHEPGAQPGQAVGLGEGAQDRHVRPVAVEVQAVGHRLVADVLPVGLVEHDQAVGRHLVEEGLELGRAHHGAGRVVRVADEDQPGARGDRGRHRGQVVGLVAERDPDRVRGGQVAQDRVRLEGAPRVHHLGAGLTDRLEELLGHSDRTAPDRDVLRRDAELVRDGPDQGLRAVVRVPVDRSRRLGDGIHHRGQRRERSFVG